MEADVLNALTARAAFFTGTCDRNGRWMICVPVPGELQPWSKRNMELAIAYLLGTIGQDDKVSTAAGKFVLLIDTQKCTNRQARSTVRHIEQIVDTAIGIGAREATATNVCADANETNDSTMMARVMLVVVRSDAFWDKQLVDNCTKTISSRDEVCTLHLQHCNRNKCF